MSDGPGSQPDSSHSPPRASQPLADSAHSVRLALTGEATAVAAIQRRAWPAELPSEVAERLLTELDLETMAQTWQRAIQTPPEARFRVLVAVTGTHVVTGFAVTIPAQDPDADPSADGAIEEFVIDPSARGQGHGSRLLNACADTLRADGFRRATWWVSADDDDLREFLTGAGWAADGAHREIGSEDESVRVKQVRLHTDLTDPS